MNQLMRWTLVFATLMLIMHPTGYAWYIGQKGRISGPSIHTTYFLTPNNQSFPVTAQAYVGLFVSGRCVYSSIYNLGTEILKTGDFIDIDAFALKSTIGPGYNCITIRYNYKQQASETFQLYNDGINYVATNPQIFEVTIL